MTVIQVLVALLVIVGVGYLAYWIITKFFPEPMRMIALAIVGVILLVFLMVVFFPGLGEFRVWR